MFYENINQVTGASNWDVMPPSYSVNKDQNLEISSDFLGRNRMRGFGWPLISLIHTVVLHPKVQSSEYEMLTPYRFER